MQFKALRLKIGGLAAAVVMSVTAALLPLSLGWVSDAREDRQRVEERLTILRVVLEALVDAETGQRGYVITGKDAFLQPYHVALAALPAHYATLQQRYESDHAHERELVAALLKHAQERVRGLSDVVTRREAGGFAAAEPMVSAGHGKESMDRVRQIAADLGDIESRELAELDAVLRAKIWRAIGLSVLSTVVTIVLLTYLGWVMTRAIRAGELATAQAKRTSEELARGVSALERRNGEISTLGEMSRVLQAEMTLVEALEVTSLFAGRLLPGTNGAVYLFRNSADLLELAASWGEPLSPPSLEPTACWGLRRGQMHRHRGAGDLRCRHCEGDDRAGTRVCLPLMAYGEMMGLLYIHGPQEEDANAEGAIAMAQSLSEQVALALSNAKLRQVLRDQSIKDPLTGLYNRRYMEETLARELSRAQRNRQSLSLIVADLDHFKKINDTHGHPAGDAVLRHASRQLASMVRAGDVACRFGGEEFVLILPDCNREAALQKAQQMCEALRKLAMREGGQAIAVTASFGVATAPADGGEPRALFEAADQAVYEAKRLGRNRVVVAGAQPAAAPLT